MEKTCPRCNKIREDIKFRTFGRSTSQDPELPAEVLVRSKIPICAECFQSCRDYYEKKYKDKLTLS